MKRADRAERARPGRGGERSFRGLPARITLFSFWATVITSLAIAGVSIHSIQSFLRERIDDKFPDIASRSADRVDLWYEQRSVELGVFASNDILRDGVLRIENGGRAAERAAAEVEQYLRYLLEGFPQYESLVLRGASGAVIAAVGEAAALTRRQLDAALAARRAAPGPLDAGEQGRVQLVSASLEPDSAAAAPTLHAGLDLEALDRVLQSPEIDTGLRAVLVDPDGRVVASSAGGADPAAGPRTLPDLHGGSLVSEYDLPGEGRMIGSAAPVAGSRWQLVVEEPFDQAFSPLASTISRIFFLDLAIILLFGLGAYRIAVGIVQPIEALADGARRISEGERELVVPERGARDEIRVLIRTFNDMTVGLARKDTELEASRLEVEEANAKLTARNEELQRVNEILEQLSITGGLTQLHNHRFFQDHLSREVRRVDRTGESLALILADIDHFKAWNDRLGHAAGDRILRKMAEVLNDAIRETDLLARYGGEEFALLAPGTDLDGAVALAEKMRGAVGQHRFFVEPEGESHEVTLSLGVAVYRGDRDRFFEEADRALYAAKAAGRDCVCTADDDPRT